MGYCRKIGGMVTVPECLTCEECLPPGDRIDGKGTWQSNPWVFVYEFELIK